MVDTTRYLRERGGALQRKTLVVLSLGTILGGLGVGASLSVGALLLAEVSGSTAISGLASAMFNAGAALAGIPLARLAVKYGRRRAIVTGNSVAILGAAIATLSTMIGNWMILALGIGLLGVASAVQLLSRFTATDLANPGQRARDLSIVVWMITIGAVIGPNLMGPGALVGDLIGVTPLAGVFTFTIAAQTLAALISWVGLRPDPLLVARSLPAEEPTQGNSVEPRVYEPRRTQFQVIAVIGIAQAIMVALMAMAPLHIVHTGGSNELVGFTLSLHIAGMYALSPLFGFLASRYGRIPVIHLGWVILVVSVILAFVAGESHGMLQVSMVLLGFGWGAITVAGAALVTEITPPDVRTARQGQSDTIMSGSGAFAGVMAGVLFAWASYESIAVVSLGLIAAGLILTFLITAGMRRSRECSHSDADRDVRVQ